MLHILLMILKWIGILLLSVLGFVLLLILLVLFVPVRYRIRGSYEETPEAKITVSWLFHILHAKVRYQDTLFWQLRIFGIPIKASGRPKKEKTKNGDRDSKKIKADKAKQKKQKQEQESPQEEHCGEHLQAAINKQGGFSSAGKESVQPEASEQKESVQPEASEQKESEEQETAKQGVFAKIQGAFVRIRSFFRAIRGVLHNIRYTIHGICDKIKNIRDKIGHYHDVLTCDEGKKAIALVKEELGKLLKHIAPRKFRMDFTFGFDDPATTGEVMAMISMFYPIWSYDITLHPDFNRCVMQGHLFLKGRVRIFTLLRIAWKVYFNKNLKKVLRML